MSLVTRKKSCAASHILVICECKYCTVTFILECLNY